jgi:hypothetical protein
MKGKKGKDDIDLATLPDYSLQVVAFNFLSKEANRKRTKEAILKTKRTDFGFVTREELKTFAKEKGLFVPLDDKKKDKAAEGLPRECTPEVFAEAFAQFVEEQHLAKRLEKKEIADALATGKPLPTKKKDEKKKDPKKKKDEEEVEEVEEQFNKDYEFCFIIENYPENKEEVMALGQTRAGFDFLLNFEPHFVHKKTENLTDPQADPNVIKEEPIKAEENEEFIQEISEAKLTTEEYDEVYRRKALSEYLQEAKVSSIQKSKLRQALAADLKAEITIEELNESWDKIKDTFFKRLAELSLTKKDYKDWLKGIHIKPLMKPKYQPKPVEEVKEDPKDKNKKKDDPKDKNKKKDDEIKEIEQPKIEEPKEQTLLEAAELLGRLENSLNVKVENLKAVNILDAFADILDRHKAEFDNKQAIFNSQTLDSSRIFPKSDVDYFLDDIFNQIEHAELVKAPSLGERTETEDGKIEKGYENKGVYSVHDFIGLNKRGKGHLEKAPLQQLEEETFEVINIPGVRRFGMPEIPTFSAKTRKYKLGQLSAFHEVNEPELRRRLILKEFENILEAQYPIHGWHFLDRVTISHLGYS